EDMMFDAFISCSYEDRQFANSLIKTLESRGYCICYHEKDFVGGVPIAANIQHAVLSSKRTICLLSKHFFASPYCMFEFQMALDRNIRVKKNRLV
ncbi:hypothetical protein HELRODRAFT_147478, partial [Helobdella robusta]|uniref:TIR domain-containing protein n=1 Tax=Helobdella robusta TaxID=6412 RepID=T1EK08_HELRO